MTDDLLRAAVRQFLSLLAAQVDDKGNRVSLVSMQCNNPRLMPLLTLTLRTMAMLSGSTVSLHVGPVPAPVPAPEGEKTPEPEKGPEQEPLKQPGPDAGESDRAG